MVTMAITVQICCLLAFVSVSSTSVLVEPEQEVVVSELDVPAEQQDSPLEEHDNFPEVETINGIVRGFTENIDGTEVHTFLGIPFAAPPIGDLRFKRPVAVASWTETLEAKSPPACCPQLPYNVFPGNPGEAMWNPNTAINEDCLYLNIWMPSSTTGTLATMVWIYGGSFSSGSSSLDVYNGKYLAAKQNVVVVSMNYRVGPLGFLYLGVEDAPGNVGLLDQNLALKWVYDNIEKFGGDRHKINIFGESSGSASVHYHTLSQKSSQYISSAIMQSGSALAPWAFSSKEEANVTARMLARVMNCDGDNVTNIVSCLRGKSSEEITEAQFTLPAASTSVSIMFRPTLDDYFLTAAPSTLLQQRNAKIPMLMGVDKNELSYFLNYALAGDNDYVAETLSHIQFVHMLPSVTEIGLNNLTRESIIQVYDANFRSKKVSYVNILDDVGGDLNFKCPTLEVAAIESLREADTPPSTSSVYVYSFEHRTSSNPWPLWTGVLHGDEIEYIFGMPHKHCRNFTSDEILLSDRMMEYWATFAKTGNPNPINTELGVAVSEWPEYRTGEERYMVLDCGNLIKTGSHLRRRECRFWRHLYPCLQHLDEQCENK